jgi:hypothetical protein
MSLSSLSTSLAVIGFPPPAPDSPAICASNAEILANNAPPPPGVLGGGTDAEKGLFRLRPLKIDVSTLTPAEKRKLRTELEGVLRHVAEV